MKNPHPQGYRYPTDYAEQEQRLGDEIRQVVEAVEHFNKLRKQYGPRVLPQQAAANTSATSVTWAPAVPTFGRARKDKRPT